MLSGVQRGKSQIHVSCSKKQEKDLDVMVDISMKMLINLQQRQKANSMEQFIRKGIENKTINDIVHVYRMWNSLKHTM